MFNLKVAIRWNDGSLAKASNRPRFIYYAASHRIRVAIVEPRLGGRFQAVGMSVEMAKDYKYLWFIAALIGEGERNPNYSKWRDMGGEYYATQRKPL